MLRQTSPCLSSAVRESGAEDRNGKTGERWQPAAPASSRARKGLTWPASPQHAPPSALLANVQLYKWPCTCPGHPSQEVRLSLSPEPGYVPLPQTQCTSSCFLSRVDSNLNICLQWLHPSCRRNRCRIIVSVMGEVRRGKGGGRDARLLKSCATNVTAAIVICMRVYKKCSASIRPAPHPTGDFTPASCEDGATTASPCFPMICRGIFLFSSPRARARA